MMDSMYTLLGTSQQPKLPSSSNDRLFVVTRKPLTPLPTIAAETHTGATGSAEGKYRPDSPETEHSSKKTDRKLTFEMGKRVKRNGTAATTVKVVFPGSQGERDVPARIGTEFHSNRCREAVRRSDLRKTDSLDDIRRDDPFTNTETREGNTDENWTSKSSQIHTMGGKREREFEGNHSHCVHPYVTRVDILFKPLPNSAETGEDHGPKTRLQRKRGYDHRQLTKHRPFGSKESISLSTSNLLASRLPKPDPFVERDELTESTESSGSEGTWDSTAYTAKNTRIEFARTLHVPRHFVLRRNHSRWSRRKPQEKTRLCSRHLQHTRSLPRRLPSPHPKDSNDCPGTLKDPWLVTPTQRRFEPARPLALTCRAPKYALDITRLRHKGMTIGPSHPHLQLAAINSVYNCNILSLPGTVTPPVSEADSLEYLDDFEAFNLKVKMDVLINKFKELCRD